MIDLRNLSVQFTGENLFEEVNLKINKGDKIALVGSNGTGKSTLLKLIAGRIQPETGDIFKQKNIKIGYLPQELLTYKDNTLFSEVKSSMGEVSELEKEEEKLHSLISSSDDEIEKEKLIHKLGEVDERKHKLDYYVLNSKIEKVLSGLGFRENDFERKTEEFSGGWQMRIEMAKILLGGNDLILLDEPTNHLDIDSLEWITNYLKNYPGAVILVSHDRYFVNEITDKTLEIFRGNVNFYNGNYEKYLKYKEERDIQLRSQFENQQKKIKETERFIERFRYKASKARQVQSRIKALEKIELVELPEDEGKIDIKFPEPPRGGAIPVELINVSQAYDENYVFRNLDLKIDRGEKIAFVGPNGAGKTTLAKLIAGKLNYNAGEIRVGYNTYVSYYAQEVAEDLKLDKDVIDTVAESAEEYPLNKLRTLLGSFLFTGDEVFKKVGVLSGGEKSRVALSKILLTKANLIILDEPTNHLDFNSKRILQKALIDFPGTLIIVSHDINFLEPIINKVFEIRDGNVKTFYGGIDYYLRKKKEFKEPAEATDNLLPDKDKISRKDQKRIEAQTRQERFIATKELKKELDKIESRISDLEEKKIILESDLTKEEIYSNPDVAKDKNSDYENIKRELDLAFSRWAELTAKLEEIEGSFSS